MNLGLEIQKTNVGIKISILEIPRGPIFRQNGHFLLVRSKFAQILVLASEFQNFKSRFGISTTKIPYLPILSQTDNFDLFWVNLENLPNCIWYFGSNNVEGYAESWVKVEMNWVDVDVDGSSWFSNTRNIQLMYSEINSKQWIFTKNNQNCANCTGHHPIFG